MADEPVDVEVVTLVDRRVRRPRSAAIPEPPKRDLQTVVWLPATDAAAPLIVLAHSYNGHPRKFSEETAQRWAEAGYVVAVPRFPVTNDEFPGATRLRQRTNRRPRHAG